MLKCFSGCSTEDICTSLGLKITDLFNNPALGPLQKNRIVYSYTDEQGHDLYRKIRVEPGFNGKPKDFFSERTENGHIIKNLKGCEKVLYRLPEVLKAISDKKPIFLVEGEKDADKLYENELTATTSIDSLKWQDQYTELLKNADIVILYDMDKTGLQRRDLEGV